MLFRSGNVTTPSAVIVSGTYQLVGINVSGCTDTALVAANFLSKPNIGADKSVSKCSDSSFNLTNLYTTTGLTTLWKLNGAVITSPSVVSAAGIYQLIATNSFGCADTALVTLTNDIQLCPVVLEKIIISPNPVIDILTISVIKIAVVKVEIYAHNATGQKVYSINNQQAAGGQTYSIPMKALAAGIYYVTVKLNDKKEAVKKIMKR